MTDERYRLQIMGDFKLTRPDRVVFNVKSRKGQALLAYLALREGYRATRDHLAALFWSETEQSRAKQSLRQVLFHMQKSLEKDQSPSFLAVSDHSVSLLSERLWTDVWAFQEVLESEKPDRVILAALEHYSGELLQNIYIQEPDFDQWLSLERDRLRTTATSAAERILEEFSEKKDWVSAARAARIVLQIDPYREDVTRQLMKIFLADDKRVAALREFQRCRDLLLSELGVLPEAQTQALYDSIAGARPLPGGAGFVDQEQTQSSRQYQDDSDVPPGAVIGAEALPDVFWGSDSDSLLVGRDREIALLRKLWEGVRSEKSCGVLLRGEIGIGKSHLVDAFASEVVDGAVLRFSFDAADLDPDQVIARISLQCEGLRQEALLSDLEFGPWAVFQQPLNDAERLDLDQAADRRAAALAALLRAGGPIGRVLVAFDRVECASAFGLALLAALPRQSGSICCLSLLTDDLVQGSAPWRTFQAEVANDPSWQVVALPALSEEFQSQLLRELRLSLNLGPLSARIRRWIEEAAGGNPSILIDALLEATEEQGHGKRQLPQVPRIVRRRLERKLAGLDETARRFLFTATIIGEQGLLSWIGDATEIRGDTLAEVVRKVSERSLMTAEGEAGASSYRLLVPGLAHLLGSDYDWSEVAMIRQKIRRVIAADELLPGLHADHLMKLAEEEGDGEAGLTYRLRSIDYQRRRFAFSKVDKSVAELSRSLAIQKSNGLQSQSLEQFDIKGLLLQAQALETCREESALRELLEQLSRRITVAAFPGELARLSILWARLRARGGEEDSALEDIRFSFGFSEAAARAEAWFRCDVDLAKLLRPSPQALAAEEASVFEHRLALAKSHRISGDQIQFNTKLAAFALLRNDGDAALSFSGEGERLSKAAGDGRLEALCKQLSALALLCQNKQDKAERMFEEALHQASQRGDLFRLFSIEATHAAVLAAQKRWQEAKDPAEKACQWSQRFACREMAADSHLLLGHCLSRLDDLEEAMVIYRKARDIAADHNDREIWLAARQALERTHLVRDKSLPEKANLAQWLSERLPPALSAE